MTSLSPKRSILLTAGLLVQLTLYVALTGCRGSSSTVPTPQQAASGVTAPIKATTQAVAGARDDVISADRHLADLQGKANSSPTVPSADVNSVVTPARTDLSNALSKLSDVFGNLTTATTNALAMGTQIHDLTKRCNELQAWKDDVWNWWLGPKLHRSFWWCLAIAAVLGLVSAVGGAVPWLAFITTAEGWIGKALKFVLTAGIPHLFAAIGAIWKALRSTKPTVATPAVADVKV